MNAVYIVIAIHAGILAFGFGLAGILQFQAFEEKARAEDLVRFLDPTGFVSAAGILANVGGNWRNVPSGRRFIYASIVCFAVTVDALFLNSA